MQFHATGASAAREKTGCAIVGVHENAAMTAAARELDRASGGAVARVLRRGDFTGKAGEVLPVLGVRGPAERVLLVGLGAKKGFNRKAYRRAITAATQWLAKGGTAHAVSYLATEAIPGLEPYYAARQALESVESALYRIPDLKTGKRPPRPKLARFGIAVATKDLEAARRGIRDGRGIAAGMALMRDLANLPANVCTPAYLAGRARQLAREHRGRLRVRVLDEREIRRLRMGSFLSVTRGSDVPPRLIVLDYRGGRRGAAPVALIGKGITFDTGGISLKQSAGMDEMKFDMSGAASVLGAIKALATIGAAVNVVGIVPTCENMPSGRATKPGDIVRSMAGKTIEVLNTDAEGRLILCDAISYSRRFKPRAVVDIATLTGACVIALGAHYCGLFSPDDGLAQALHAAGERADDRAWHMPVAEEYSELLKSNFADLANVAGREAGAITAACFLWKFTEGLRWAHLDIAGTAYLTGSQKGSTGRPVPLLVDWLLRKD